MQRAIAPAICAAALGLAWLLRPAAESHPRPVRETRNRSARSESLRSDNGTSGTFSIVAIDPDTGVAGAAVASKYPAVGAVVPFVRGGVGAFCTQHWHNPTWGARALELLAAGKRPAEILDTLLRDDDLAAQRQLAVIDARGRTAQHNPTQAPEGSRWWGSAAGRFYACQGNTLTGREVIADMAAAYENTDGSLADRLLAALVAGDCAGGDHRGRLAAAIVVARPKGPEPWLDLRVDRSDDAVKELARKYAELAHEAKGAWTRGNWSLETLCPRQPAAKPPAE